MVLDYRLCLKEAPRMARSEAVESLEPAERGLDGL